MTMKESDVKSSLLRRWTAIEKLENEENGSASFENEFRRQKEDWFLDAFTFLDTLPQESHCWCMHKDITWPLLEPFHNYRKDFDDNPMLGALWKRMSLETRRCIQCVVQYHKAQEFYKLEFVEDIVKPLLDTLRTLDFERVTTHLNDIMRRVKSNAFNIAIDSIEVICVMFEVLSFPFLLEDVAVNEAFTPFLQYVHTTHDISLAEGQRYPGLYTLFFHPNLDVRRISLALANPLGYFLNATELEPVQPFLEKCIRQLEYDLFEMDKTSTGKGRFKAGQKGAEKIITNTGQGDWARIGVTRESVWIGLQTLLGLLKAQALEEGVVERYPSFVGMVLNHVSEATPVFWNALRCLKLLLEVLGYKLWLRTTFSPGVMRNTLLSQCFHTQEEKIHNAIFDLFQPFLKSLESLQDGEYERQRRYLIYFLLQQVPFSRNFRPLMSKKGSQIAFSIVAGGYKMRPPSPPVECVHVWGPPLIATIKDASLHNSLRQPAIELFEVVVVEDAAALALLSAQTQLCGSLSATSSDCKDIGDDETDPTITYGASDHTSCWENFNQLSQLVESELKAWKCVPLLWLEVLESCMPTALPHSIFKATLWGVSRLSIVEEVGWTLSSTLLVSFKGHMYSKDVASALQWAQPKGCDDGADGKGCVNSVKVEFSLKELISIFKRCASHFIFKSRDVYKDQLQWEPRMTETLILLLIDHNQNWRELSRNILHQISCASGLEDGLQYICCSEDSMVALCRGLTHAQKLILAIPVSDCCHSLEQVLFIVLKLLTTGKKAGTSSENLQHLAVPKDGGFLRNPFDLGLNSVAVSGSIHLISSWKKYAQIISFALWPVLEKVLIWVAENSEMKGLTMMCSRLLDLLPVVLRCLNSKRRCHTVGWVRHFIDWGKIDCPIVRRHWNKALLSLIDGVSNEKFPFKEELLDSFGKLLSPGSCLEEEVRKALTLSYTSISHGGLDDMFNLTQKKLANELLSGKSRGFDLDKNASSSEGESDAEVIEVKMPCTPLDIICVDSEDDDQENASIRFRPDSSQLPMPTECKAPLPNVKTDAVAQRYDIPGFSLQDPMLLHDGKFLSSGSSSADSPHLNREIVDEVPKKAKHKGPVSVRRFEGSGISNLKTGTLDKYLNASREYALGVKQKPSLGNSALKTVQSKTDLSKPSSKIPGRLSSLGAEHKATLEQQSLLKPFISSQIKGRIKHDHHPMGQPRQVVEVYSSDEALLSDKVPQEIMKSVEGSNICEERDSMLRELVSDTNVDSDPLELALENARKQPLQITKPAVMLPRRQLIRLEVPGEQSRGIYPARFNSAAPRAPPPRLDVWYKCILALDYFAVIGCDSTSLQNNNAMLHSLVMVPFTFESSKQYIDIFKPLLLEEFKAQLQRSHEEMVLSDGMTIGLVRLMSVERVDDFQLGRFIAEDGHDGAARACFENDLLLLSRKPLQFGPQNAHVLAKVERKEKENKSRSTILVLKLYFTSGDKRLIKVKQLLVDRSKWHVTRLMSLTPQLREFQALLAIDGFPLLPVILYPKPNEDSQHSRKMYSKSPLSCLPEPLRNKLKADYNESQLNAIESAISNGISTSNKHKLSLVQGPPGTGKTSTIIAIISAILATVNGNKGAHVGGDEKSLQGRSSSNAKSSPRSRTAAAIARSWQDAALAREISKESVQSGEEFAISSKGRILVCAQSNAAVDELVSRICKNGLYDLTGSFYKPAIVRVGNAKTIHSDSMPVFIDNLVEQRVDSERTRVDSERTRYGEPMEDKIRSNLSNLRMKLEEVTEKIQLLEARRSQFPEEAGGTPGESLNESASSALEKPESDINAETETEETVKMHVSDLYRQRRQICAELAKGEMRERKLLGVEKTKRQSIRLKILKESEIVITTLSGCGGDVYSACMESTIGDKKVRTESEKVFFDAVIIDEAAQALEPATLIPLQLLKKSHARCIMIGDPKQLPATVLSQAASKMSYECSMFERFQKNGFPVTMLTTQYRMHPEICRFPSGYFYERRLIDFDLLKGHRTAAFHNDWYFGPYVFFDVAEGRERAGILATQSLCNEEEVEVVLEIFQHLRKRYPTEIVPGRVGIITPYKQQLSLLREKFTRRVGSSITSDLEFNTVDGFQGREVDILIFSTVRASAGQAKNSPLTPITVGFVGDVRRMNVALTRARFSLWIVGNAGTLQVCPPWASLIDDAKTRGLLFSIRRPYTSLFSSSPPELTSKSAAHQLGGEYRGSAKGLRVPRKQSHSSSRLLEDNLHYHHSKHDSCEDDHRTLQNSAEMLAEGFENQSAVSKDMQNRFSENQNQMTANIGYLKKDSTSVTSPIAEHDQVSSPTASDVQISSSTNMDERSKDEITSVVGKVRIAKRAAMKAEINSNKVTFACQIRDADSATHKRSGVPSVPTMLSSSQVGKLPSQVAISQQHEKERVNSAQGPEERRLGLNALRKRQREEVAAMMPSGLFIDSKKQAGSSSGHKFSTGMQKPRNIVEVSNPSEPLSTLGAAVSHVPPSDSSIPQSEGQGHHFDNEWDLFQKALAESKKSLS